MSLVQFARMSVRLRAAVLGALTPSPRTGLGPPRGLAFGRAAPCPPPPTLPRQVSLALAARAMSAAASSEQPPKAALLIIGNEVLSGKIQDTNTATLAKLLYARGVDMVRAVTCPDEKEDIIATVRDLSERVGSDGFVFTSGGIGPTHDDVTYEAIAEAFGRELEVDAAVLGRMSEHYTAQGKEVNDARLRMATIPNRSEVLTTPGLWVPLVCVDNVYILPGIPRLFTSMVEANKERFKGPGITLVTIKTMQGEGEIAEALTAIATEFPLVQIGSYPKTQDSQDYTTRLCFEGRDAAMVQSAVEAARQVITVSG